jgi:hypothetical protein
MTTCGRPRPVNAGALTWGSYSPSAVCNAATAHTNPAATNATPPPNMTTVFDRLVTSACIPQGPLQADHDVRLTPEATAAGP